MQVAVSPEINELVDSAAASCMRQSIPFVGVEHLFETLIARPGELPQEFVANHNRALNSAVSELSRKPWPGKLPGEAVEVFYTPRCANCLNEASRLAQRLGAGRAQAGHLLLAILADAHASPSRVIDAAGYDRGEMIQALRDALAGSPHSTSPLEPAARGGTAFDFGDETGGDASAAAAESPKVTTDAELAKFTRDLTALAKAGKIDPAIGRDREMQQIIEILSRRGKSNVILVGDAGVGKTQVVEGFAIQLLEGAFGDEFKEKRLIELNMGSMMAGTQYRGAFEEKLLGLLEKLKADPNIILFIDEMHLIMGAGATEGGGADMANLLKPPLARGEIKCIGATTLDEYRQHIAKDPAMERRFQMLRLDALSPQAAYEVLKKLRPSLEKHHGVRIAKRALRAAIVLTKRYMPNRHLPDKAIDVLDQTCARHRLKQLALAKGTKLADTSVSEESIPERIGPHEVRKVVARLTGIPLEEITAEERQRLSDLETQLARVVIGQDEAVKRVCAAVKRSRAGLSDPNRPDGVMMFLGPSGVGKSQLAKSLASIVFGSSKHLRTFDMSEYTEAASVTKLLGASAGYVGHEEDGQLTRALSEQPFSILLFDEIEKAHNQIYDIFLPILDEGRVTDAKGRELSFKNNLIIFTSNVGAELVDSGPREDSRRSIVEALHEHFRPEFINRIDEIVPFCHLLPEDIRQILNLHLKDVKKRLRTKGVRLHVYQGAYEYLAEEGYHYEFGARELRRTVERRVVDPISSALIDGEFKKGDTIAIKIDEGSLVYEKETRVTEAAR